MKNSRLAYIIAVLVSALGCQPSSVAPAATVIEHEGVVNAPPPISEPAETVSGAIMVRGITTLDEIVQDWGGLVVEAREFFPIDQPALKLSGLRITVIGAHRSNGRSDIANVFVGKEEIDALIAAIEVMRSASSDLSSHAKIELEYRTASGFGVSISRIDYLGPAISIFAGEGGGRVVGSFRLDFIDSIVSKIREGQALIR